MSGVITHACTTLMNVDALTEEQCRAELAGRRFGGGYAHGGLTANGRPGPPEAG